MAIPRARSVMSSTTAVPASTQRPDSPSSVDALALVIAWSAAEPHRAGEVAIMVEGGSPMILGRGLGEDTGEPYLRFFRQRPGTLSETPPLASPGLSRRQLRIEVSAQGVQARQVGRCPLSVNGVPCDAALLRDGDVVTLRRELVLLCVLRPALMPPPRLFPRELSGPFGEPDGLGLLGESPHVWRLREALAFAAKADHHVLLVGQSGTGKELAARAVHRLSARASHRWVARNAATFPPGLIDAELFGNVRNYPNPGMPERPGLVGEANGGTLFLDEIGELPAEQQAHLLRVLDRDGEYQRLGEASTRRSELRLVGATNRDPAALKHDFLARFTTRVELPALVARREDIPVLARHLVLRAAEKSPEIAGRFVYQAPDGTLQARLEAATVEHLVARRYAANVRDLEALLWSFMAASEGAFIGLPEVARASRPTPVPSSPAPSGPGSSGHQERPDPGRDEIVQALAASAGSVPAAARALGLSSRYVLYRLMKKHGIEASPAAGD